MNNQIFDWTRFDPEKIYNLNTINSYTDSMWLGVTLVPHWNCKSLLANNSYRWSGNFEEFLLCLKCFSKWGLTLPNTIKIQEWCNCVNMWLIPLNFS